MHAHRPVLLDAVLESLAVRADGAYLDGTFGRGGHASAILARLGSAGRLVVIDRDPRAIEVARELAARDPRVTVEHGAFSMLEQAVERCGLAGRVDGILLDLGVSSPQLDDASRGFSFQARGPLDMRMDPTRGESAADYVASAS
jgi:16S rRNA (cytosine1402-N4)-methyltransferase